MDVIVSDKSIKFKALGGPIDLFFFAGPTPLEVIEQYTRIIGKPAMLDYRILGFHQSRYGYKNISEIRNVVAGYKKAQIPLDTIWFDIDYMEQNKDFTFDEVNFPRKELSELVENLVKSHQRIIPILDPGIKIKENYCPYVRGLKKGIFIRNPNDAEFYIGEVWPGNVHFIDFFHEKTLEYWKFELETFFRRYFGNGTEIIGGLWLDMNEPSNFINGYNYTFYDMPRDYPDFSLNFPRYLINNGGNEEPIYSKTVPMDAMTSLGPIYQTHNIYGLFESIITIKAMREIFPSRRPFLLTRSTFPGSGHWTATWLGDNLSTFPQMALSIAGVLQYGLMGLPLSGPDICGFIGNATEELCARWMALGAFYPFARNHNSIDATVDQEPFKSELIANVSRKYLQLRYSLFPFYYSLLHTARVKGCPIWRPVFFYDNSTEALNINDQFFMGREILASPVLMESADSINVRLPVGEWYEWESFNYIKSSLNPIKLLYKTPLDFIPIHIRAGSIIVMNQPKLTMFETRRTNFTMLLALDSLGKAAGDFYWDDGESSDVEDQFIDISLAAKIVNEHILRIDYKGEYNSIECPFVQKLIVLSAGKFLNIPKNESEFKLIKKSYGFELIFNDLKTLKNGFSIELF